jgi:assimilatory nitrate reductase catalytic subunit
VSVVRTTCPYCGVGCGVLAQRSETGAITVQGDPAHPANRGRLCSKGTALAQTLGIEGRLLAPEIHGQGVSWDAALDHVASRFAECIARHGPDSVALYVSGQMLTEDYYAANKFAKGFLGTANIDTNSRLCMSSAVSGHQRAFGEDVVPVDYTDLEAADLLVLVGSNTAWCHPVLMQRVLAARESRPGMRIVVIDPRRTATCEYADLHLQLRSGSDVSLFNGLLAHLATRACRDDAFITSHTTGFGETLDVARAGCSDIAATAQACGLDPAAVEQFFEWFALTSRTVTLFSQGVNQSSAGTDKVNSIINCHLATGRIGKPGAGPFSITGQPNAMGGREVGGLATQLAAHLSLDSAADREAVRAFWNSPRIAQQAGLKSVDLFRAVREGRIKALWIMATNPVVSLPDADEVRQALRDCDFVVVSDCVASNDTLPFAHVKLPAAAWGEKDGTVTNSDRHVSRQRAFLPTPGLARPDWWIVSRVAQRMGFRDAFAWDSARQVFEEHARLTELSKRAGRVLDLTGFAGIDANDFEKLEPRQWPFGTDDTATRPFADGCFATPDGRARFVQTPARLPRHATSEEFPLVLNTGRSRDQWHTMTRTALAPVLNAHEPEPSIDANAADLVAAGLQPGQIVRVVSRWGSALGRLRASGQLPSGMVFMPMHWSGPFARSARVGAAVNPAVDPVSGEPEFKHTPVRLQAWKSAWQGFLLSRPELAPPDCDWFARTRLSWGTRWELAGETSPLPDHAWLLRQLGEIAAGAEWIEYQARRRAYRGSRAAAAVTCLACGPVRARGHRRSGAPRTASRAATGGGVGSWSDDLCLLWHRREPDPPGGGKGIKNCRESGSRDKGWEQLRVLPARTGEVDRSGRTCGLLQQSVVHHPLLEAGHGQMDGHRLVSQNQPCSPSKGATSEPLPPVTPSPSS